MIDLFCQTWSLYYIVASMLNIHNYKSQIPMPADQRSRLAIILGFIQECVAIKTPVTDESGESGESGDTILSRLVHEFQDRFEGSNDGSRRSFKKMSNMGEVWRSAAVTDCAALIRGVTVDELIRAEGSTYDSN